MAASVKVLRLRRLDGEVVVWRADPDMGSAVDVSAMRGPVVSLTRTSAELSGVCDAGSAPAIASHVEPGWAVLELEGPLDFSLTGVLASIATPLANARISIFAVSTFDTDYVLVRTDAVDRAGDVLRQAGHEVI